MREPTTERGCHEASSEPSSWNCPSSTASLFTACRRPMWKTSGSEGHPRRARRSWTTCAPGRQLRSGSHATEVDNDHIAASNERQERAPAAAGPTLPERKGLGRTVASATTRPRATPTATCEGDLHGLRSNELAADEGETAAKGTRHATDAVRRVTSSVTARTNICGGRTKDVHMPRTVLRQAEPRGVPL